MSSKPKPAAAKPKAKAVKSESESDSSDYTSDSDSTSEDESPVKKKPATKKLTQAKKAPVKAPSKRLVSESESDSSDYTSSEYSSSEYTSSSESESESDSDDDHKSNKATKAIAASKKAPVKAAPSKQQGGKKKENIDDVLAEFEPKEAAKDDAQTNGAVDESKLTKAQLKRLRQKQKQQETPAPTPAADTQSSQAAKAKAKAKPAEVKTEPVEAKPTTAPAKKGKESKAVAALKEQLRLQKEEEERRVKAQEEARRRELEELKAEEELAAKKAAEKEARRIERQANREQLKKEGKLLTKAQKEKAKKAEMFKQQLAAQGVQLPDKDEQKPKEKKVRKHRKDVDGLTEQTAEMSVQDKERRAKKKQDKKAKLAEEVLRIREQDEAKRLIKDEDDEIATLKTTFEQEDLDIEQQRHKDEVKQKEQWRQEDEKIKAEYEAKQGLNEDVVDDWMDADDDEPDEPTETKDEDSLDHVLEQAQLQRHQQDEQRIKQLQQQDEERSKLRQAQINQLIEKKKKRLADEAAAVLEAQQQDQYDVDVTTGVKTRKEKDLRAPICCILGHVDTGKTKLLDKIRSTNVQGGESGGITQQIGATFFPQEIIMEKTRQLRETQQIDFTMKAPGLLIIDTPGHESFTNLRSRGSNLCDIAILNIDIMHGLEQQTIESINLLKSRKTPFIISLNKIDRCYDWKAMPNAPLKMTLENQKQHTRDEYEKRCREAIGLLAAQSLNCELYYKNADFRKFVSIVPTSAITGEGIPDLLMLITQLTQQMMNAKLSYISELQCTVLEVKVVDGYGTTIDVVLVNGVLNEGDTIVVCGLTGPIVTSIRALLTPPPLAELRIKSEYLHSKQVKAAMGVKIAAPGLETAIAGSQLLVCTKKDDIEELKDQVQQDLATILSKVDRSGLGVCVQASTLGSLEALLSFLSDCKIPVSGIAIGPVHKKDVVRASVMLERKSEYAVILSFDVKVEREAQEMADKMGVRIFQANIIYHLFDMCSKYFEDIKQKNRESSSAVAVFPCVLDIMPNCVFNNKNPLVIGCKVVDGCAKIGTPLCVLKDGETTTIGKIISIENNHVQVTTCKKGEQAAFKIEQDAGQQNIVFGRHFDYDSQLLSRLSRESIDALKQNFKDDLSQDEWKCVIRLKKSFQIQ